MQDLNQIQLSAEYHAPYTRISIIPPNSTIKSNTHICCVVDVSGSMGTQCAIKTNIGNESHGLSILDIVKHALRTIAHALSPNDLFSLIAFDDQAKIIIQPSNDLNTILNGIQSLSLGGSTNLWDGLVTGLECMQNTKSNDLKQSLFILTDGLPNINPPRGELHALQQYLNTHTIHTSINTFGFGYQLDSKLLMDLAFLGNGIFAFIPDASLVGSVFINACANAFTIHQQGCQLNVVTNGKIPDILSPLSIKTINGYSIHLGNIYNGQIRSILIHGKIESTTLQFASHSISTTPIQSNLLFDDVHRYHAISIINTAYTQMTNTRTPFLLKDIQQIPSFNPYLIDLRTDLNGQVSESISRLDWFDKWGKHYLLSLKCAHLLQQCHQFKDPGVQHYGNMLFKSLQDEIEQVFLKLPPPMPSTPPSYDSQNYSSIDMSQYYNSSNPCFDGNGRVHCLNGYKLVRDCQKGDYLQNGAMIQCVLKTNIHAKIPMVSINGLWITPYHPILVDHQWKYPIYLQQSEMVYCDYIYSFVLDKVHTMEINCIICVTLGHLKREEGVYHAYFGDLIIGDLKRLKGFEDGLIEMPSHWLERRDGRVIGMINKI
eukprot:NODE_561_length_6036_cov_1.205491.p2 type:complete len:601 gc:universal NODE_561_length_6036_cov_1.205491:1959-157(-)